jgi:hypothetical protein
MLTQRHYKTPEWNASYSGFHHASRLAAEFSSLNNPKNIICHYGGDGKYVVIFNSSTYQ